MRLFLIGLGLLYVVCAGYAQSVTFGSSACSADANVTPYVADKDVEAKDLNPWRSAAGEITPYVDVKLADTPNTDRIFARLAADPKTGEALRAKWTLCDEQ